MSDTKPKSKDGLQGLDWANEFLEAQRPAAVPARARTWDGLRALGVLSVSAALVAAGHVLNGAYLDTIYEENAAIGVFSLSILGALASLSMREVAAVFGRRPESPAARALLGRRLRWTAPVAGLITAGMGAAYGVGEFNDVTRIGAGLAVAITSVMYASWMVLVGISLEAGAAARRIGERRDGVAIGLAVGVVFTPLVGASAMAAFEQGNWVLAYWLSPWQYCLLSAGMLAPLAFDTWRGDSRAWAVRLGNMALGLVPAAIIAMVLDIIRIFRNLSALDDVFHDLAVSLVPAIVASLLYMGLRIVATRLDPEETALREQRHGEIVLMGVSAVLGLYAIVAFVLVAIIASNP